MPQEEQEENNARRNRVTWKLGRMDSNNAEKQSRRIEAEEAEENCEEDAEKAEEN